MLTVGRGTKKKPLTAPPEEELIVNALRRDGFTVRNPQITPTALELTIGYKDHPRFELLTKGNGPFPAWQERWETINEVLSKYQQKYGLLVFDLKSQRKTSSKKSKRSKRKRA